jgi:hypothetical protein
MMKYLNQLAEWIAFSPLGIGLGLIFGCSLMYVLLRPSHIEPQPQVLVTVQPTVVRVPTKLPPTPVPQATVTPAPTERPTGALYTVKAGDNMTHIVKRVCRSLGYSLYDYEPTLQMLVEQNVIHNRQYANAVLQPDEEVGIGCVLP